MFQVSVLILQHIHRYFLCLLVYFLDRVLSVLAILVFLEYIQHSTFIKCLDWSNLLLVIIIYFIVPVILTLFLNLIYVLYCMLDYWSVKKPSSFRQYVLYCIVNISSCHCRVQGNVLSNKTFIGLILWFQGQNQGCFLPNLAHSRSQDSVCPLHGLQFLIWYRVIMQDPARTYHPACCLLGPCRE